MCALEKKVTACVGRLDQVVGQCLFPGREPGPDFAARYGTPDADGFGYRQWLGISSALAKDARRGSENKGECQER